MGGRTVPVALLWCSLYAGALASPSPLKEIGHVSTTETICGNVVVHANAAIAAALRDDQNLARIAERLRSPDVDLGAARRVPMAEVDRLAGDVRVESERGAAEAKRLAAIADGPAAAHPADLRTFAAALASALDRQLAASGDVFALLDALAYHDLRGAPAGLPRLSGDETPEPGSEARRRVVSAPSAPTASLFSQDKPPADLARLVAGQLDARLVDVARDETRAAERATAAVTGC